MPKAVLDPWPGRGLGLRQASAPCRRRRHQRGLDLVRRPRARRGQAGSRLAPVSTPCWPPLPTSTWASTPNPREGGDPYCQARWCWSDAIFMAPPAWIALSKETWDPRYLAHADNEFWATTDLLYDKDEHLYFRDSRFIAKRSAAGAKIFWGRGNGWAFAGLARILQDLPKDHPSRPRYEAIFKEMAAKDRHPAGRAGLLARVAAGAAEDARDQRHRLLRLRPGLGREPRPAARRPDIARRSTRAGPP
jgi:hypothetical protein